MSRNKHDPAAGDQRLPLIGAQLSSAGGWDQVPLRATEVDVEVVQVFSSNPRMWPKATPDIEALSRLEELLGQRGLPLFMHAVYLINPASPDESLRKRSASALAHALLTAALAGAAGVVTHLGSHRGEGFDRAAPWVTETLRAAWTQATHLLTEGEQRATGEHAPRTMPPLLLETAAGSGASVGATLAELETLLGLLSRSTKTEAAPSTGLCLDTAHMFAAGYAVHEEAGLTDLVDELQRRDLLQRVALMHLNDSASLFASKKDRHANPGEGEFGQTGLARVVRHPAFLQVPFVLEVPGSQRRGPGRIEVAAVKTMRSESPARPAPPGRHGSGPTEPG